jgi:hypothetical protein
LSCSNVAALKIRVYEKSNNFTPKSCSKKTDV